MPTPKVRVLVADDEEGIAKTLASILELAGYEACALYDGNAALRFLELFKPDLVLTDVSVPGPSGVEIALAAMRSSPRCKVLLLTGNADLHQLLRTDEAEGLPFDLMMKPIRPDELLAKLRVTLRGDHPSLLVPIEIDGTIH